MGFPRQEYWSGLLFPSPGDLPKPEIEPRSPALQVDSLPSESPRKPNRQVGGLQKSVCQFPCGRTSSPERLLPALVPQGSPGCLLTLQEVLQGGLTQAHLKVLPLCWVLEHERFCMCPLRVSFCFPQPSTPPVLMLCWPLKPDVLGACLLSARPRGWGC